jgi:hypothetical protein
MLVRLCGYCDTSGWGVRQPISHGWSGSSPMRCWCEPGFAKSGCRNLGHGDRLAALEL